MQENNVKKLAVESQMKETRKRVDAFGEIKAAIDAKADREELETLKSDIDTKIERLHSDMALYLQTVNYARDYLRIVQDNMQNLIDEARKRLPKRILRENDIIDIVSNDKHKFDLFYLKFEDTFRGSRENIKERVKVYLPYLEKLPFEKEDIEALDLGCGRGEWMELLTEEGYGVRGIDINSMMVHLSRELGLNAIEADAIEYLSSLEDDSLEVITGFHIIEHLPFESLVKIYGEALRVLKPGGMVIFETPNPNNITVGASSFYTDPTHINPIPPHTTKFILSYSGFVRVKQVALSMQKAVQIEDPTLNHFYNQWVNQYPDYAIVGYKFKLLEKLEVVPTDEFNEDQGFYALGGQTGNHNRWTKQNFYFTLPIDRSKERQIVLTFTSKYNFQNSIKCFEDGREIDLKLRNDKGIFSLSGVIQSKQIDDIETNICFQVGKYFIPEEKEAKSKDSRKLSILFKKLMIL